MTQIKLERMIDAYRDACCAPLDDTALKRRINRTLRERAATNRQRPWLWLFGLGGMLTASLAGATPAGRQVISWLEAQLPHLEQRQAQPPPAPALTKVVATAKPRAVAPTAALESDVLDLAAVPATLPDLAAVPATLRDDVVVAHADVDSRPRVRSLAPASAPVVAPPAKVAEGTRDPNGATALYERAYQLQFTQVNYRAAVPAWDNYLNAANGGGALVGEARFHRAVCLVALGRYSDARSALTKIANGAGGPAYRARAHTLLQALESASQR